MARTSFEAAVRGETRFLKEDLVLLRDLSMLDSLFESGFRLFAEVFLRFVLSNSLLPRLYFIGFGCFIFIMFSSFIFLSLVKFYILFK